MQSCCTSGSVEGVMGDLDSYSDILRLRSGQVIAVLVSKGDIVEKGQGLVIVEAMKMENEVRSPIAATVKEIKVKAGDTVEGGAVLVIID